MRASHPVKEILLIPSFLYGVIWQKESELINQTNSLKKQTR